jgi:hypothetical protein
MSTTRELLLEGCVSDCESVLRQQLARFTKQVEEWGGDVEDHQFRDRDHRVYQQGYRDALQFAVALLENLREKDFLNEEETGT